MRQDEAPALHERSKDMQRVLQDLRSELVRRLPSFTTLVGPPLSQRHVPSAAHPLKPKDRQFLHLASNFVGTYNSVPGRGFPCVLNADVHPRRGLAAEGTVPERRDGQCGGEGPKMRSTPVIAGPVALARRGSTVPLATDRTVVALVALPDVWAGLALHWWAVRTLGTHFPATIDIREDQPVIRTGPYRYVRHPSYTGAACSP